MKLTTIALAGALALCSTLALAQSSGSSTAGSTAGAAGSTATGSSINGTGGHGGHGNRTFDHGHDLAEWAIAI